MAALQKTNELGANRRAPAAAEFESAGAFISPVGDRLGTHVKEQPIKSDSVRQEFWTLLLYSTGEGATSLVMNGLNGFAMLFYTDALGLPAAMAATALSLSVFWEAVTEPAMGYISDRTRTRWGARIPWILAGGLLMSLAFVAVWNVPDLLRADHYATFAYLVVANLLLRTSLTAFFVPYLAVGFEMIPSYNGRSRLQAFRQVANMFANFCGPALAWAVFFRDGVAANGQILIGTKQADNYLHMAVTFAAFSAAFVLLMIWGSRRAMIDNRAIDSPTSGGGILRGFWLEFKPIIRDAHARRVFVLTFLACAGMVLVSSMQSYVYVYFMKFGSTQRVIAHGSTMLAMAIGGALSAFLSTRFDKKGATAIGAAVSGLGAAGLALAFLPGWISRTGTIGFVVFVAAQGLYWLGSGIVLPVLTAMIGDVAELSRHRTGQAQEGGYAAAFSLAMRMAISFSMLVSGWVLSLIGFDSSREISAAVVGRLGAAGFLGGAVMCLLLLVRLRRYPLNRQLFEREMAAGQIDQDLSR